MVCSTVEPFTKKKTKIYKSAKLVHIKE